MNKFLPVLLNVFLLAIFATQAKAASGDASFTPTGFKIPIMKITISKNTGSVGSAFSGSNENVLYKCSSTTEANCLIDLGSQSDLDKIAAGAANALILTGTYDQLAVYTCADGKGGSSSTSVFINGSFSAGAGPTTYYTDPNAANTNGVSSAISGSGFAEIPTWGCATQVVPMPSPLVVSANQAIKMNLLVDISFLGNSGSSTSPGMGGCKVQTGGGARGVCASFPVMTPYVGSASTSTKRFKMAWNNSGVGSVVDNKANAIIIVPMAGTTPLMAFSRPFSSETSATMTSNGSGPSDATYGGVALGNATDVSTYKVNANGSLSFQVGGSLDNYSGAFTAFQLIDHTSTATYKNVPGTTWYYHAILF